MQQERIEEGSENPRLYAIRHSLAHILAQAVQRQYPEAKLGFGPPTATGFYYDFDFGTHNVQESDLAKLENAMRQIIKEKQVFKRSDTDFTGAMERLNKPLDALKRENVQNLKERGVEVFSFYENGPFSDLCEGPHVTNTSELPTDAFKLDSLAGAYWLGDEKNKMLTRIYALAFENKQDLAQFIKRRQMAQDFDHKKLGRELEIFHQDDYVGKGLPLWLPNGEVLREEIQNFAKELEFKHGYKRVSTPVLAKEELYLRSQHLPAYEEGMFPPIICKHGGEVTEKYYLRPMNCPHHHLVYASKKRSYRELPLRLAEYGTTFRYEQSGELNGLLRVRGMTLNDAHIYCRFDQIEDEVQRLLNLYMDFYKAFKFKDYSFRLSLPDQEKNAKKYKGDEEMWNTAEAILTKVLNESGINYYLGVGEAAFYGPKIDIQFKNLMGREETVSTIQLDFLAPKNFDLNFVNAEGKDERPVILHRAPLSTLERIISYLLEYYGGAFPTWLAPVQVALIPVNDTCLAYCQELAAELQAHMVRAEIDDSSNSFGKKIRSNTVRKIPNMLIIGNAEVEKQEVTLRRYGVEAQEKFGKAEFLQQLLLEIKQRANNREPMGSIV